MESSLRINKNKTKFYKMKNSFDSYILQCQEAIKNKSSKKLHKENSTKKSLIQSFRDNENGFQNDGSSLAFQMIFSKKIFDSKEFQSLQYSLYSTQKSSEMPKTKRIRTLSYQNQRMKSTIKTEVALKDLKQLNQLKINKFQYENKTIRFNKEIPLSNQISMYQTYDPILTSRPMSLKSNSLSKPFIIKKAKKSLKKQNNCQSTLRRSPKYTNFRIKECQNIFSQDLLYASSPMQKITAWQTTDQSY